MKKRILSILLTLCMLLCLVPTGVFAEGETATGSAAIQLGTDALSKNVNTATAPTVYFGQDHEKNPAAWRVIGYDGNGVASAQGDMTLLAAGNMSSGLQFADFGASNEYAPSNLKTAIDALAKKLTTEENVAVKKRTLTSGGYTGENTDCVAGGQVDNAVFWPLSSKEANAVKEDLRVVDPEHPTWATSNWWLRSPGYSNHDAATVRGDGSVVYSGNAINSWWCARPAFNLNSSSVLFTSAAVGGKPDGGLTPISEYTGNEWKLTLKDSNRNFAVTETTVSGDPGDTVTLHYTGATAGINEYISVILADNSGAQYYGRVAQPTVENGTVEIKIPSGLAPGSYTLKVFSEQCNGEKKTDYASDFVDIDLTVGYQEQFSLAPGGTYYFDLSGENIPGTANGSLPDASLHYVPFTYAGTVNAYKLTSAMATTDEYAQQNKYAHSLFVADYAVTHAVRWYGLNDEGLIFGKNYASGGVDYTLRAPSVGSDATGLGDSDPGVPQSNEWDTMLNKDSGYIQNWNEMFSWGQDTVSFDALRRAVRGYDSARHWLHSYAARSYSNHGFRPVLEVRNPNTLGPDGLKAVTLALGGGKLGGSSDAIHIIVKTGSEFTAPASDGLNRPDGNTGSYFMWLGSDGKLYAPGASVPADVTKLTAQFALSEQFSLKPGGRYYFDLSGEKIPGTANGNLPDSTLHYVPFTYAGTIEAYKLTSAMVTTEEYAQQNKYAHSLFVADYAVTHTISWGGLNDEGLIFGKNYASGGVDYTLRAPSVGSNYTGSGNSERGVPQSNEWDTMLNKDSGYIQNWNEMYSWGQDTVSVDASLRAIRGYTSARYWSSTTATNSYPDVGFRPVLEVLNPDTLGPGGLKVVTLDLGGGKLGGSSEDIQIIVKNGESFTAPASDGLTRPDGDTGNYFNWLGSDGKLYEPGDNVSADVTRLTAQFDEQFTLTIGDTYWFDLSGVGIPGTANSSLPDTSLHYVPFTYAGTVDAYKLTSEMVTTEEYAQKNEYVHSLFVADYVVTHTVGWDNLDGASLIFGKGYAAGSVDYMLRAPSTGSDGTGSGNSRRGTPQSNEWDRILDKDDGYIKNCGEVLSWGQDTASSLLANRARRGYNSARNWSDWNATWSRPVIGFRPVLEVLNPDTLSSDGLKAVTLDLGGGKLGGSSEAIQIIVKNGESFTAPASDGLTRPDGDTGSYFMWLGSDGKIYAPGDTVPAVITKLTAQFVTSSHSVTITTDTLPNGKVGGAYSHTLTADGTAPITWSIDSGNLPAGLSLNKDTGEISGTPTAEGTSTFTVKAENSTGSVTKELSITIAKAAPTEYTVRFNANGGGGTMEDVTGVSGSYTLPACGFTEPEGKQFKGWSTSADGSVISSTTYEVSSDTTFYAIWESKEYSIIVTDGKATNGAGSEISKAAQGTKVTLTANAAPDGKEFDKWVVESGSTTLEDANSETTTFIMPDSEVSVKATYKNAPVTTYSLTTQVNGGHGTISASKTGLTAGSTETITFTPEVGYEIDIVTVNGTATSVSGNTLNVTMNENKTVIVTYKATGGGEHTHSHGSEWKNDADNHWHECSCGDKKDTAAHTAGEWIIDSPATATTSGSKHKECTVCGYTMATETIPATGGGEHTHSHGSEWKNDADNHWHECSCGDKKDIAAHTAGEWIIDTPATATTSGSKHKECTVCGYTMATETISATGGSEHSHSYVSKVTKAATTTEEGITTYTCSKCGHSYTQTIAKIKSDDSSKGNDKDNGTSIKPYIKGESGKEGWDVIKPELEEAKSGDTVTVAMNGTTVVPKDILDSIKGKDVTLVLDMENGISWKINGKEITDAAGDIDFDVTVGADAGKSIPVDVINNVTGERYSMNLTLAYDGEFGFTATLTVNMESKNAGLYANLFYYNEQTGELEFISAGQINADGNVELEFTHASDYTIVVDAKIMSDNGQADNKADETIPTPKTDDSTSKYAWNNTIIIIIGICIILIVFGAVIHVRKKDESKEE